MTDYKLSKPLLKKGKKDAVMLDFDEALGEIGECGRFQIINYILLCLPLFFSAGHSLTYVFTAGVPNYRCFVEGCDDPDKPKFNESWILDAIPKRNNETFEQCKMYFRPNTSTGVCSKDQFQSEIVSCHRWVFEDNERTIVGEWDITCEENQWLLSLVGTVHFLGILFGTVLAGYLADRFGRKKIFVLAIFIMSITGTAQAFCKDYISFQVFVFLNALGTSGVYPLAFILGVEMVGKSKREMSGVLLNYFYACGEAIVGLIAWMSKDWVTLQLAVSVPPAIFIFYYWIVPESVRWLLAKKDVKRAGHIMKKAAKMNGVKLSRNLLNNIEKGSLQDSKAKISYENAGPSIWEACRDVLKSGTLRCRSIVLFYVWAANAFIYYGLSVNSTTLGGNKYLNFSLVCLIELPGYTISWIAMNKLGRRWSFSGFLLLCGVTCVAAAFVPSDLEWAVILLFLLGKLGITASFNIAYVYSAELYPTIMRSIAVGACSTVGRLGALVAPFAPLLGVISKPLPLLLFGGVSAVAGGLALILPETLGTKLPTTVEEAHKMELLRSPNKSGDVSSSEKESDREN